MRLSILSVLGETLMLWAHHWRWFALLAAFLYFPSLAIGKYDRHGDLTVWNAAQGAAGIVVPTIFQAIGMAATLSLFAYPSPEKSWLVMVKGVQCYTGQLVGVRVLLVVFSILLMIPVGFLYFVFHAVFGLSPLWIMLGELLFLLFLKYALANPLVVAENLKATAALGMSWRMTQNRFVFVFGCYLISGVAEWALRYSFDYIEIHLGIWKVTWTAVQLLSQFVGTYWYALAWVMYQWIKAADGQPVQVAHPEY